MRIEQPLRRSPRLTYPTLLFAKQPHLSRRRRCIDVTLYRAFARRKILLYVRFALGAPPPHHPSLSSLCHTAHSFCESCIKKWIAAASAENPATCPTCRCIIKSYGKNLAFTALREKFKKLREEHAAAAGPGKEEIDRLQRESAGTKTLVLLVFRATKPFRSFTSTAWRGWKGETSRAKDKNGSRGRYGENGGRCSAADWNSQS